MSTNDKALAPNASRGDDDVAHLTKDIEHTRAGMSATLSKLEHRLPAELGEKAKHEIDHLETRVKAVMKEGLDEAREVLDEKIVAAKAALHEEIIEAQGAVKAQLHETKDLVTKGLADAKESLKSDLRGAIEHTKQSMRDATLGRVEDIATKAGDAMNTTRDTLVETIRQNPIPAALAGVGIAWLLMNRSSAHRQRTQYGDGNGSAGRGIGDAAIKVAHRASDVASDAMHQVGGAIGSAGSAVAGAASGAASAVHDGIGKGVDALSHAADGASHLAHDARDRAGAMVHSAADAAGAVATGAVDQARRAEHALEDTLHANPLALGAVALAVGAAVGYSLPRTERENALMGAARDRVLDGASHLAHDASQSLFQIAGEAGDSVKAALGSATK